MIDGFLYFAETIRIYLFADLQTIKAQYMPACGFQVIISLVV